jgi:hypothetical protein
MPLVKSEAVKSRVQILDGGEYTERHWKSELKKLGTAIQQKRSRPRKWGLWPGLQWGCSDPDGSSRWVVSV